MDQLLRAWADLSPGPKSCVLITVAGILGGLASAALDRQALVFPKLRRGRIELGFVGTVLVSVVAAHAVDHGFSTALVAAVCGGATLRRLKAGIDRGFDEEHRQIGGGQER